MDFLLCLTTYNISGGARGLKTYVKSNEVPKRMLGMYSKSTCSMLYLSHSQHSFLLLTHWNIMFICLACCWICSFVCASFWGAVTKQRGTQVAVICLPVHRPCYRLPPIKINHKARPTSAAGASLIFPIQYGIQFGNKRRFDLRCEGFLYNNNNVNIYEWLVLLCIGISTVSVIVRPYCLLPAPVPLPHASARLFTFYNNKYYN